MGFAAWLLLMATICLVVWYLVKVNAHNNEVLSYRVELIYKISDAAKEDARHGRSWQWRIDYLNRASYYEMAFQPWLPMGSFYPDKSFITRGALDPKLPMR